MSLVLAFAIVGMAQQVILSAEQIFPLDALVKGDYGYALTAGEDNALLRFEVEVLGLQRRYINDAPVVLIKAHGEVIEAVGGLAAGMSGSPVYLEYEGEYRLLGALGYTFPHSDHTLGLVTPITFMQEDGQELSQLNPASIIDIAEVVGSAPQPIRSPLLVSGLSGHGLELFRQLISDELEPLALQMSPLLAPEDASELRLQAGSAISVQLLRGDVIISALGTLTHVIQDEDTARLRFYALGHPLLSFGDVDFALAPAYVNYIVPSQVVPFKLANVGTSLLGAVRHDNDYGIRGWLGEQPDYIPVNLSITGPDGDHTSRFSMVNDPRLYRALLAAASMQAFDSMVEHRSAGTADIAWDVHLRVAEKTEDAEASSRRLRVLEQVIDDEDIARRSARTMAAPLQVLAENIFADVRLERVDISLRWHDTLRFRSVVDATSEKTRVEPGSSVPIFVRVQHYRQQAEVLELAIPIPEEADTETLRLLVRGGNTPGLKGDDGRENDPILSFDELLLSLREQVQGNELIVETLIDGEVVRLYRETLAAPVVGKAMVWLELEGEDDAPLAPVRIPDAGEEDMPNDDDFELPDITPPSEELSHIPVLSF